MKLKYKIFLSFFSFMVGCFQNPGTTKTPLNNNTTVAAEAPHPDALKYFMDAQLYISQNNYPMAIIELQDALKYDPNTASIHTSLAGAYWNIGKIDRAEEHLLDAIKINSNDIEARYMLANQYIVRHQYDLAAEQLDLLIAIDSSKAKHYIARAELAAAQMQWEQAIQLYRHAYAADPGSIHVLEKAADIALSTNKIQIARDIFTELVRIDKDNIAYLSVLADLLIMEKQFTEVGQIVEQIIAAEGQSKEQLVKLGVFFFQKGQFDHALALFKKAHLMDSDDLNVLHFISSTFLELNQLDSVNYYSDLMIAVSGNESRGYLNKALAAINNNELHDAIVILKQVSEKSIDDYSIQYLLGNAYYQVQEYDQATMYLQRALNLSPQSRSVLHILAIINDARQQWAESDSIYQQLIKNDSTDAQAFNNYAYSLVERNKNLSLALLYAMKATTLVPSNAAYLDTYGWIHFNLGNIDEALHSIKQSLEIDNSNAVVLEHMGDVLLKANRKNEAIEYFQKAFELDNTNKSLQQKAFPR